MLTLNLYLISSPSKTLFESSLTNVDMIIFRMMSRNMEVVHDRGSTCCGVPGALWDTDRSLRKRLDFSGELLKLDRRLYTNLILSRLFSPTNGDHRRGRWKLKYHIYTPSSRDRVHPASKDRKGKTKRKSRVTLTSTHLIFLFISWSTFPLLDNLIIYAHMLTR